MDAYRAEAVLVRMGDTMSRSGYSDDLSPFELGRWRGQVASATRGARGQKFFRDLIAALDAMPEKKLVKSALETKGGAVCALGALGRFRAIILRDLNTYDHEGLAEAFDIAHQLAQETMYVNDELYAKTDEERWLHVREWATEQIT